MTRKEAALFVASLVASADSHAVSERGEMRDSLREKGIELSLGYLSETATNFKGGERELGRYADQWTFGASLNLEKLLGLSNAEFQVTLTDRNGRNLSLDAKLGSLQEVQEIYGRGQTWHWTQLHYHQTYLDGKLDWKIGRLAGAEDFADFSCEFMNLTFCGQAPGNIATNFWYTWPISQWGTRLKVAISDFGYVQFGAFESNPRYLETRHSLDLGEPGGATGALVPLEVAWQPVFAGDYKGAYKFGVWYNSSNALDVSDSARSHDGHLGAYFNFLQHIRGASFFVNGAFNDRNTSTLDRQITAGVFFTGVLASRPHDEMGFALGQTHVNPRAAGAETELPTSESVVELFCGLRIARWIEIRPSLQFVHSQRDLSRNATAIIGGARVSIDF
jgi:porin